MKILIGCEESQTVCKAFRELGLEAYSNDLKPCSGGRPEWHLQMDVQDAIKLQDWGFIGLHPDCRKLTNSGNRVYAPGKVKNHERVGAIEWTISLFQLACSKASMVYMENPRGSLNTDLRLPKPQTIQPYFFGDEFQKTTCLWLYGLPQLIHSKRGDLFTPKTHVSSGEMVVYRSGKKMAKWSAILPSTNSEENRRIRSKTFPGIAQAMAEQWGAYIKEHHKIMEEAA